MHSWNYLPSPRGGGGGGGGGRGVSSRFIHEPLLAFTKENLVILVIKSLIPYQGLILPYKGLILPYQGLMFSRSKTLGN